MFAELSGDEPDWFQMAFYFERQYEIDKEQSRFNTAWRRRLNPEAARAAARAAKQTRLAAKQCVRCKRDAATGRTMCEAHLAWQRDRRAKQYANRVNVGRCPDCGGIRQSATMRCDVCRDNNAARKRAEREAV